MSIPHAQDFRPEIHALRAAAVTLVILFHLWPDTFPGGFVGVDVFFLISGFLITGHLQREIAVSGRVSLSSFWARRARRLLPAAMLVLVSTGLASWILLPKPLWQDTFIQIGAAGAYVVNWVLAAASVDYFAADSPATAVQHYWSLSVEEQFYLVWPLIISGLAWLARYSTRGRRHAAAPVSRYVVRGVGALAVASFLYSVWLSPRSDAAYFSTLTHVWQFALGALLCAAVPFLHRRVLHPAIRAAATWLGFVVLLVCGITFDGELAFPGWIAAVPLAGAALVIGARDSGDTAISAATAMGSRPVQWLGDVSYAAYLWHWPLIVLVPYAVDRNLAWTDKVAILLITFGLSHATKVLLEDPVRFSRYLSSRNRLTFASAAVSVLLLVGLCALAWSTVERESEHARVAAETNLAEACHGAGAVLSGADCPGPYYVDPELLLATDGPSTEPTRVRLSTGMLADEYHPDDSGITVAVVGDSHARMYVRAMQRLAERHGWRLLEIRHNDCTPSAPTWESTFATDMKASCQRFRQDLIDRLAPAEEIDLVVTSSVAPRYADMPGADHDEIATAFETTYRSWLDHDKAVVVIADVPGTTDEVKDLPACVAAAASHDDPCALPRASVIETDLQMVGAERLVPLGLQVVDFTDAYCDAELCHAAIGGLVAYAEGSHLSRAFSESLAPHLEPFILQALDR